MLQTEPCDLHRESFCPVCFPRSGCSLSPRACSNVPEFEVIIFRHDDRSMVDKIPKEIQDTHPVCAECLFYWQKKLGGDFLLEHGVADTRFLEKAIAAPTPKKKSSAEYLFVHACPDSTFEDIQALTATEKKISMDEFVKKIGKEAWSKLQERLGYDKDFPITKDKMVQYRSGEYRGKDACFLRYSAIEYIFTKGGNMGPTKAPPTIQARTKPSTLLPWTRRCLP